MHTQTRPTAVSRLNEEERLQGFVTTAFTHEQIALLLLQEGVFVAVEGETVVAYVLAGTWDFFAQWPIFPYMETRLASLNLNGRLISKETSFQYGPVCIDSAYRGQALFQRLFDLMRKQFAQKFPIGVTFINQLNQQSYFAHTKKLKMQLIDQFDFAGRSYYGLAFETRVSGESN